MIPVEAIKAAADALSRADEVVGVEDEDVYDYYLRLAHASLEAAAPHMLAGAWDAGGKAAIEREHTYGAEEKAKFSNPYRPTP